MARKLALLALLCAMWPHGSRALGGLGYTAPAGCPTAEDFWSAVRARLARDVAPDALSLVEVTITATTGAFEGLLGLRDDASTPRRIDSASCEDVAQALALAAALAIDRQPPPSRAGVAAEVDPHLAGGSASRGRPVWRLTVGANVSVVTGVLPAPALTLPIFASLEHPSGAAIRLVFLRGGAASEVASSRADFSWTAARLEASPFTLWLGDLGASPFALIEGGILAGTAEGVANPEDQTRPWVGLGAGAWISWRGLDPVIFEGAFGAVVPIVRDHFYFSPGTAVHDVSPVAGFGGGGARVAFF